MSDFIVQTINRNGENYHIIFDYGSYLGLECEIVNFFTQFGETTCDYQRVANDGRLFPNQRITKTFQEGTITQEILLIELEKEVIRILTEMAVAAAFEEARQANAGLLKEEVEEEE